MSHIKIKNLFSEAVNSVVSDISRYIIRPQKDLTRNKKIPADKVISFMVSCGSSSTKIELLDFFGLCADLPSASALIQPVHQKDEFAAFCKMVDRHDVSQNTKAVFIGDRGYCSYNNMAHVLEKGQYFLFRTKDIHSKGLVGNFDFPKEDSFDIRVNVTLVRSQKRKITIKGSARKTVK